MENSIDAQQCEGGGGSVDWELVVMPLGRALSWRWSERIDQSIFLIWGMRRKAKTDGIWEANTKEETQEKRITDSCAKITQVMHDTMCIVIVIIIEVDRSNWSRRRDAVTALFCKFAIVQV